MQTRPCGKNCTAAVIWRFFSAPRKGESPETSTWVCGEGSPSRRSRAPGPDGVMASFRAPRRRRSAYYGIRRGRRRRRTALPWPVLALAGVSGDGVAWGGPPDPGRAIPAVPAVPWWGRGQARCPPTWVFRARVVAPSSRFMALRMAFLPNFCWMARTACCCRRSRWRTS